MGSRVNPAAMHAPGFTVVDFDGVCAAWAQSKWGSTPSWGVLGDGILGG